MKDMMIGITMGDPSGIGPEITVKALGNRRIYEECTPVVIGDGEAIRDAVRFTGSPLHVNEIKSPEEACGTFGTLDLIDLHHLTPGSWQYKKVCKISGESSFQYIVKAIQYAMEGKLRAVVTGPINKEAIHLAGHDFSGHTEIFAHYTNTPSCRMLLISRALRVIHVTTHVSMRQACDIIRNDSERVAETVRLAKESMELMGIEKPRIAVAGLNAHCSENGLFGDEEAVSIIPAIQKCQAEGINVDGPVPPDTVFVKAMAGQYDIVVAMYHDQGHIPLKLSGFKMDLKTNQYTSMSGVNCTVGLPIIRTSVDHGTAFGKAGEGRANEESMIDSIDIAVSMAKRKFGI